MFLGGFVKFAIILVVVLYSTTHETTDQHIVLLASGYAAGMVVSLAIAAFLFRGYPVKQFSKDMFDSYKEFAFPTLAYLMIS